MFPSISSTSLSKASTGKRIPALLVVVSVSLCTRTSNAIADVSGAPLVTELHRDTFHKETHGDQNDWVVVFCHDSVQPCAHMTDSFKKLAIIWEGSGLSFSSRFGEVNCASEKALCDEESITQFPTAIHYRNGMRVSSWQVEGEKPSMVWQFVAWAKNELSPAQKEPDSSADGALRESGDMDSPVAFNPLAPFADMDHQTAAVGWVLVLGTVAIVAWVIVDGFELWPALIRKDGGEVPAF